ncbi:hypothetical protein F5Y10DRAFT_150613 [Nemania abortiva]|nr:hypothetical protein F5Y10DRAFT_150613 [Nemania abortiva]
MAEPTDLALCVSPIAGWAFDEYSEPFETSHPIVTARLYKPSEQNLTRSLGVSIDLPSDRALWNWSRVKHGLDTKKRNNVPEDPGNGNEALTSVAEETELPEGAREAEKLRDSKTEAPFESSMIYASVQALSTMHLELASTVLAGRLPKLPSSLTGRPSPRRTHSSESSKRSKMVRFASLANARTLSPARSQSPAPSCALSVIASPSSPGVMTSSTEITNLCSIVCTEDEPHSLTGYFKGPDNRTKTTTGNLI